MHACRCKTWCAIPCIIWLARLALPMPRISLPQGQMQPRSRLAGPGSASGPFEQCLSSWASFTSNASLPDRECCCVRCGLHDYLRLIYDSVTHVHLASCYVRSGNVIHMCMYVRTYCIQASQLTTVLEITLYVADMLYAQYIINQTDCINYLSCVGNENVWED